MDGVILVNIYIIYSYVVNVMASRKKPKKKYAIVVAAARRCACSLAGFHHVRSTMIIILR